MTDVKSVACSKRKGTTPKQLRAEYKKPIANCPHGLQPVFAIDRKGWFLSPPEPQPLPKEAVCTCVNEFSCEPIKVTNHPPPGMKFQRKPTVHTSQVGNCMLEESDGVAYCRRGKKADGKVDGKSVQFRCGCSSAYASIGSSVSSSSLGDTCNTALASKHNERDERRYNKSQYLLNYAKAWVIACKLSPVISSDHTFHYNLSLTGPSKAEKARQVEGIKAKLRYQVDAECQALKNGMQQCGTSNTCPDGHQRVYKSIAALGLKVNTPCTERTNSNTPQQLGEASLAGRRGGFKVRALVSGCCLLYFGHHMCMTMALFAAVVILEVSNFWCKQVTPDWTG